MPELLTHPPVEDLAAFALGVLDDEAVADHVSECPECQRAVAAAPGDTFTDILADAKTVVDAPAPGVDLPAELAEHPRYTPLRLLGVGGMGTVWLAEHTVMGRRVAVKVIRPEFTARPGAANRFRREVAAAARLHHPNIVTAFDAEQAGDAHFLAMEYVDGVGLDELLKEKGALPVAEACRYVADAATGLDHAHNAGLVHRDVKPGNLMRAADGTVKVLDFGLAMLVADDRADASLTGANMVVGTPDYIAPEQAEHPHAADGRADVYALGCTLYHLLAGAVPFPGSSVLKKLDAHRRDDPKPLSRFRTDIPRGLSEIVMKMMAKDPAARFASAAAVAHALRPYADGKPPRRERPRRFAAVAGVLFFALIVAGAVVYRIQTDKGELVISTQSDDVEIAVKQGGRLVTIIDTKTQKRIELKSGEYDLELKNADGLKLDIVKATLTRGKEVLATIERIPAPAVAMMPGMGGMMPGIPLGDPVMPGGPMGVPPGGMSPPGMPMGPPAMMGAGGGSPGNSPAIHWPPTALPAKAGFLTRLPIRFAESNVIRFSPDGRMAGFLSNGYVIGLLETATGKPLAHVSSASEVQAWAFTPDSATVVLVTQPAVSLYQFEEWTPASGEVRPLGEPIRLTSSVEGVTVQGAGRRLVLQTRSAVYVYDTTTRTMVTRVDVRPVADAAGPVGRPSASVTGVTVSADGRRAYAWVADQKTFNDKPRELRRFVYVYRLTDDDPGPAVIEVPSPGTRIFDIQLPAGSTADTPAFGLVVPSGDDQLIRWFTGSGKLLAKETDSFKAMLVRDVAAFAPRLLVSPPGESNTFELLDFPGLRRPVPVTKVPNYDAFCISPDGRVFAVRTETGWNLIRLPDPPPPVKTFLNVLADGTVVWRGQPIKPEDVAKRLPAGTVVCITQDYDAPSKHADVLIKELTGRFELFVRRAEAEPAKKP